MSLAKVSHLLEKEVSRKEFFQHVGVITLGVIGVTGLMSNLSKTLDYQPKKSRALSASNGYGARPYGR